AGRGRVRGCLVPRSQGQGVEPLRGPQGRHDRCPTRNLAIGARPDRGRRRLPLGLAVAELLEEATRRRTSLALILALGSLRAVRDLSGRAQPEERDLTDLHVWVNRNRQGGAVGQPAAGGA